MNRWLTSLDPGMRLAEGVGFEPTEGFYTLNGLANRPIRPLSHPSVVLNCQNIEPPIHINANTSDFSCPQKESISEPPLICQAASIRLHRLTA